MSNHLAIAAVTTALKRHLQKALDVDLPGAQATALPPQSSVGLPTDKGGVNIYLYQVTPNLSRRNADTPTRTPGGVLTQRPRVALDLHYLLTFYGDDSTLAAQVALASVARKLHAEPALPRTTIAAIEVGGLATSDLRDAPDLVRFTPTSLSLEELSKLWSVMLQTPYALSLAYVATLVTIEVPVATASALPVRSFDVAAVSLRLPVIDAVLARAPGAPTEASVVDPILAGHVLVVVGRDLAGDATRVCIDGFDHVPSLITDTRVEVALPGPTRAGAHGLQIVHDVDINSAASPPAPVLRPGPESRLATFVVRPSASFGVAAKMITANAIAPPIGPTQRVELVLDRIGAIGSATLSAPPRSIPPPPAPVPDLTSITFDATKVLAGDYLVRLRVDGADSVLDVDAVTGKFVSPKVTL